MKSVILILCTLLCGVYCVEEDARCAWGPSYWCQGLKEAKACGAMSHCKTTVWTNQIVQKDGSEVCQFCEAIIGDVKRFIEQKKTEEQIAHFLSTACGVIPKQQLADECRTVVELALTEIIELLTAEVDPQTVCALMKICSGFKDTVNHAPIKQDTPPSDISAKKVSPLVGVNSEPICTDCKKFFTDIKNMITANKTEAEIEQMIDSAVCALLGSMEDECKSLVHAYLPEIMILLQSYYDPAQICQSLGVCAADKSKQNILLVTRLQSAPFYQAAVKQNSPGSCFMCMTVMHELQSLDQKKEIQEKIKEFIKKEVCGRLAGGRDPCNTACDEYLPEIFEFIATELDPKTRCRSLGFCSSGLESNSIPMVAIQPAKQVNMVAKDRDTVAKDRDTVAKDRDTVAKVESGPVCVLCEFVMRELKEMIGENATESEIMDALGKVCDRMPKSLVDSCHSFVEMYGPAVIQLLLQELDPEEICTEMGLCGNGVGKKPPTKSPPKPVKSAETCAVCKTVVQYLEALVEQNATTKQIEEIIEKICTFLPDTMSKQCDALIEQYGDLVIHFITTMASPTEVCTMIRVCDEKGGVERERRETKQSVPLLGQNECTWGPSYWCLSREHAEKCNAVDHCKRTAWKK